MSQAVATMKGKQVLALALVAVGGLACLYVSRSCGPFVVVVLRPPCGGTRPARARARARCFPRATPSGTPCKGWY